MFEIIAGEGQGYRAGETHETANMSVVFDEVSLPVHVTVERDFDVDTATYAEAELSDTELLALAAEDAMDAANRGELSGGAHLDELSLRRVRRARRQVTAQVLRSEGAIA